MNKKQGQGLIPVKKMTKRKKGVEIKTTKDVAVVDFLGFGQKHPSIKYIVQGMKRWVHC